LKFETPEKVFFKWKISNSKRPFETSKNYFALKKALAYYNAGVVVVKVLGLAPEFTSVQRQRCRRLERIFKLQRR
jgi:hypothetical protein